MMLRVENDRRFSLGHARITLAGVQAPSDGGFRIVREGYAAANLGRRGWQVQEEKLSPVEIRQEGPDTVLVIGPRLTRHLEPGPLVFLLPATGLEASLFWPDDIDVFDGDLPPETLMPREPETAPKPSPIAAAPPTPAPSSAPPHRAQPVQRVQGDDGDKRQGQTEARPPHLPARQRRRFRWRHLWSPDARQWRGANGQTVPGAARGFRQRRHHLPRPPRPGFAPSW